jgi:molecular chaperone DnaK (HSP70)
MKLCSWWLTRIPAIQNLVESLTGKTKSICKSGRSSCYGAAIQAGILAGEIKDILLLDVYH